MISIIADPSLHYPDSADFFSPHDHYPEYRYTHISAHQNLVYKAVRDCLIHAGLEGTTPSISQGSSSATSPGMSKPVLET